MKELILRTSDKDKKSNGNFQYPESGYVEAPDWEPTKKCGNGLHGALNGVGYGSLFNWDPDAVWQVLEVEGEVIDLEGKVKFKGGNVIFSGSREGATKLIKDKFPELPVIGCSHVVEDNLTATAGYGGTATAGDYGTATAGCKGTATAGYSGTATARDYGTAIAGYYGTATAGYKGTATAGYMGTATAGYSGTTTAGYKGIIQIKYWDIDRMRIKTGYIGEDGLEPNVMYKVENGEFIKA